jgi:UDP-N-acetylmuramoylalanine--D-glutamate ligase
LDYGSGDGSIRVDDIEASVMDLANKHVVVVGMARSGLAAVKLLLDKGAVVRAVDEKQHPDVLGIKVQTQTEQAFLNADLVVISPGVPADLELLNHARSRGIPVIGELELAAPFLQGRTIGITGTNGKTTTTALTGHILQECGIPCQVGGNIGTAPAAMVETSRPDQWNVLELSSFQLETIQTFRAHIAACLNITQNHLDRHYTLDNYTAAKARLFQAQQPGDIAVLNADNPITAQFPRLTPATPVWFSSSRAVTPGGWLEGAIIQLDGETLLDVRELRLRGRHNYENVIAAALMARSAGASLPSIAAAAKTFTPVEHRLELVREINGVAYYNDSKATSVDATLKAIDAFTNGLWILLGGKDKNSDFTLLREPLHAKAHAALLIGAAAPKIASQLNGALPLIQSGTIDAALQHAHGAARPGDTVLLAPACASFDQFESYEHRGKVFKQLVNQLKERT